MSISFAEGEGAVRALQEVDLDIERGEFASVVGPSGCGKTSLLKLVGGLLRPSSGTVRVEGEDPAIARRPGLFSFAFQKPALLAWRNVRRNIELPREILGLPMEGLSELVRRVGLEGWAESYPHTLSGGMQQRVALARAMSVSPSVLLLDEPFAALDELTREQLNVWLSDLCSSAGTTTLLVTHSLAEAVLLSDRVLVLSARPGRIIHSVSIQLPRPRTADTLMHREFADLVNRLRQELR